MRLSARALTQEPYKGWPAYVMRQGDLVLSLVPGVGGRLMGIDFLGQELCFVHPELEGRSFDGDESGWEDLCGDWDFPLWGGGKTWLAPESAWPGGAPHRDLDSLAWQVKEAWCTAETMGLDLESPVCSVSGLQLRRRLTLAAHASRWTLEHSVSNRSAAAISCGLWDVLMLRRPGVVSVDLNAGAADTYASIISMPGKEPLHSLMRDGVIETSGAQAHIHCATGREFKCGFGRSAGPVQVDFEHWGLRYTRDSAIDLDQPYAHGHPTEVFNAPRLDYFEVETHSPLRHLGPGESLSYTLHERVDALSGAAHPPSPLASKETT